MASERAVDIYRNVNMLQVSSPPPQEAKASLHHLLRPHRTPNSIHLPTRDVSKATPPHGNCHHLMQ